MITNYFTFGQSHVHRVNNVTWDCDIVCEITAENEAQARDKMVDAFGTKWGFQYPTLDMVGLHYYHRGYRNLEHNIGGADVI